MSDDRKISDLTVAEFVAAWLAEDEREMYRAKLKELETGLAEARRAMKYSEELMSKLDAKSMSSPFILRSKEDVQKFAQGLIDGIEAKAVAEVIIMMATK